MRKYLLLIGVLLSFTVHGFAAKTNVPMTNKEKGHLDNGKKFFDLR